VRRIVDSLGAIRAKTKPQAHRRGQVMSPFRDRGEPVPHPAARPRILDRAQRGKQINRHRIKTGQRPPGVGSDNGEIGKDGQADTAVAPVIVLA
jgi:hypothetical protein